MAQTMPALDIPDFQTFVKSQQGELTVKKKEKKGAGLPWLPNFEAVKGLGFGAKAAAVLASKLGFLGLFGMIGLGAAGAGLMQQARVREQQADQKKQQFNMSLLRDHIIRQNEEMKKSVPTVDGTRNDTLGFVYQGNLGVNPNGGDASAQAAKAAADAAAKAEAEKGKDAAKASAPGAADPNAMAAAMMAQAQGAAGSAGAPGGNGANGFGRLSSGFGALKGGAGMSGGINRGFDSPHLTNSLMGKADAMRGGAAVGVGSNPLAKGGQGRNWAASRNVTAAARNSGAANTVKKMSAMLAGNNASDAQAAAQKTNQAWEGAAAPPSAINSAGAAPIGAGNGMSNSDPSIGSMPGESGPMPGGGNGLGEQTPVATVPNIPDFQNVTPYQWAIDLAKMLMIAILLVSVALMFAKWIPGAVHALMIALEVMGGLLAVLGVYMLAMGQYAQGSIWTAIGAVVALWALASPTTVAAGSKAVTMGWGALIAGALGGAGGFATSGMANNADNPKDSEGNNKQAADDYKKQYGVDPNTHQVIDPAKFDAKYGKGAADQWNKDHQPMN